MTLRTKVYNMLIREQSLGIRCKDIELELGVSQSSASGTLSALKREGIAKNDSGKWYLNPRSNNVLKIVNRLDDIGYENKSWCEGFISALVDFNFISEFEFDYILDHIKKQ